MIQSWHIEIIIILFSSLSGTSVGGTCCNRYISLSMRVYYINFVSFILLNNPVWFFFVCAVSTELKKYCILNGINAFFNENLRLPHPSSSLQPYILTTLHKVLNSFVHNIHLANLCFLCWFSKLQATIRFWILLFIS